MPSVRRCAKNWKDPNSGEWIRTFAIITTDANELVAEIHDRMPLIILSKDHARWLGDSEPCHGKVVQDRTKRFPMVLDAIAATKTK